MGRPYFEHYHRDVPCWYSMTVDVDISALLPRLRGSGLLVLSVGDPRHLPDGQRGPGPPHGYGRDGGHRRHDRMDPSYTIFHKDDETFSVLWTAYQPDLRAFCQDWEADRTRYGDIPPLKPASPEAGQGLFNISAVPWASFRSLHLELPEANDYLLPIFTLGRYRKENGRTLLPLAMQVHHGVTDGFHVGGSSTASRPGRTVRRRWAHEAPVYDRRSYGRGKTAACRQPQQLLDRSVFLDGGLVLGCPPLSGDGGDPGDGVGEHLFSPEQLPPLLRL